MKQKLLSVITCLALCLSMLPTAALAAEHTCVDVPEGAEDDPDHCCGLCGNDISTRAQTVTSLYHCHTFLRAE